MPQVKEALRDFFKQDLLSSIDPDLVVAMGAAVQASILSGETTDALLLDVVPLSLGIESVGGLVSKIIHRNSSIPTSASEMFTTSVDHQTGVDLHVLQGERELVRDCRSLGRFRLKIDPAAAGVPQVKVTFTINANGLLQVTALEQRSGKTAQLEVRPTFGLTDAEVERMLSDAWQNAEQDFEERQRIEVIQQAKSLVRAVLKTLESPVLSPDDRVLERQRLLPVVKALEADLEGSNMSVIAVRTKELDHLSQSLAEKVLNESVKSTLAQKPLNQVI